LKGIKNVDKWNVLNNIEKVGVVAVVRAESPEKAIEISKACLQGGINAIEVTYTVPGATEVIKALTLELGKDLLVGAGTVLDSETARIAILAGANYIVSPSFDEDTAKLCNRYQVPYMPGCMTITEIVKSMEAGAAIIKIFPGNVFGPSFIKAIKGPIPQAVLMPTGGVDLNNVGEWIHNGCIAVGVGGNLTKGTPKEITDTAKAFVDKVKEARLGRV
jgi:2-dehydro-3-deoxyphosphogluconate aldolase/(4S)-4-hydroxy-2-oxoglutarate aldolase